MKKIILSIISIFAFLILIGEPEQITIKIICIKLLSLLWLYLIVKANNYFYQGE